MITEAVLNIMGLDISEETKRKVANVWLLNQLEVIENEQIEGEEAEGSHTRAL